MKWRYRKTQNGQRGNALLEAAIISPMMFLMLSGVIDFGRAFYFTDMAASAARSGAQYGIQSPSNFGNSVGMEVAAMNDANAGCTSAGKNVTCDPSASGQTAYVGGSNVFSATASSYCKDTSGNIIACSSANVRGYVKVVTSISYNLLLPWPGLPNPLSIGGEAIMRTQ